MADIIECRITGTYFNQLCQNILHFSQLDGAHTLVQFNDIVAQEFILQIKELQNEHFLYLDITSRFLDPNPSPSVTKSLVGNTGNLAGEGAHPCIAGLFTIQTATPGRKGRGRFYMPGVHQQSIDQGVVQASAAASYATKAGIITTRFGHQATTSINLGVLRKKPPISFTAMLQLVSRPRFGIIRRRNVGVGN